MRYNCVMFWQNWRSVLLDALFPRLCAGCSEPLQRNEYRLCLSCFVKLPLANFISGKANPVERLFHGRVLLESANAFMVFKKAGLAQHLMHQLKYKGDEEVGIELGRHFGNFIKRQSEASLPDALTCVPLHPEKQKQRGFNQSAAIASGMSEVLEIPFRENILTRSKITSTQTRKKRYERWENMQTGFEAGDYSCFDHIGIVDDVITTGATLEACATVLQSHGNLKISVFALCISIK